MVTKAQEAAADSVCLGLQENEGRTHLMDILKHSNICPYGR